MLNGCALVAIKPEQLICSQNPQLDRHHPKPPLPSDVLIGLAVRNVDPHCRHGASFSHIIAFLSLHFPYYNRNTEECKENIRYHVMHSKQSKNILQVTIVSL